MFSKWESDRNYWSNHSLSCFCPAHWGLGEIDGLLVPPDKASNLLTDHLITGSAQEKWFGQTIHTCKPYWLSWVVIFMKHILRVYGQNTPRT